jgi:hypothetical protein
MQRFLKLSFWFDRQLVLKRGLKRYSKLVTCTPLLIHLNVCDKYNKTQYPD